MVFHDVLSCGRLQTFTNLADWQKAREAFWAESGSHNHDEITQFNDWPRDFYHNFLTLEPDSRLNLWIGIGLSDQLLLAFIVNFFNDHGFDFDHLSIFQFKEFNSDKGVRYPAIGLGQLHPHQFLNHPKPFKLNPKQITYAKSAWKAITDSGPEAYLRFMCDDSVPLPLLKSAMSYLHERYPNVTNGLASFDHVLLKNTAVHEPKTTRVIGYSMAEIMDSLDWVGDTYLYDRLKSLANPKLNKPLVKIFPPDKPMRHTHTEITAFGKAVLDEQFNAIQVNGINDWIGGVNLNSMSDTVWVRDGKKLTRYNIA